MPAIQDAFFAVNNKQHLTEELIHRLISDDKILAIQNASLISSIFLYDNPNEIELFYIGKVFNKNPSIKRYCKILLTNEPSGSFEEEFIFNVVKRIEIGISKFKLLVNRITQRSIDEIFLSVLLVAIKYRGMSVNDMVLFTKEMCGSGETFDYRNNEKINHRKIVRRYPTGALSEKIALIMPSLLMAFADSLAISSPFLVAKTLSFTGGTWDKLSSIPGFNFPENGIEALQILKECNVAMIVTNSDFNPADRFLYKFRSITNTVEAHELIVSSIASKQIGVPADSLIMDIRFGDGAFLKDIQEAKFLDSDLKSIFSQYNIKSKGILTDTMEPNGATIGNYWEVLEAIAIMKNESNSFGMSFNQKGIEQQKRLVIEMTSELICLEFPNLDKRVVARDADSFFKNGKVFRCFLKLVNNHQVSPVIINKIKNGQKWIDIDFIEGKIIADRDGILTKIDQKEIGSFINFELANGFDVLSREINPYSGMILAKRRNEGVRKGEVLATVMHSSAILDSNLECSKYFTISTE